MSIQAKRSPVDIFAEMNQKRGSELNLLRILTEQIIRAFGNNPDYFIVLNYALQNFCSTALHGRRAGHWFQAQFPVPASSLVINILDEAACGSFLKNFMLQQIDLMSAVDADLGPKEHAKTSCSSRLRARLEHVLQLPDEVTIEQLTGPGKILREVERYL